MWCAGLPAALSMGGGEGRYARGAVYSIVCTRCGQVVCRHPLRRFAGETIVRGPGGQADGFDLTQGERRGKPRACRLEECLFGGKISRRAGSLMGGSPPGGPGLSLCTEAQRGLLCRAEHPPNKGRAMGPGEAFFHPGDLTQVAPNAI